MKTILKVAVVAISLVLMLIADVPVLPVELVAEAEAVMGVRRRSHRRGVVVGYTAGAAAASASASQQQAATTQQQSAPTQQQAAAPAPSSPPPSSTGQALPLGTVVSALPGGCTPTTIGGVQYQKCGANYYRAAFQGNSLVYVTVKPE